MEEQGLQNDCRWTLQVLCSGVEDEPRYTELLQGWITEGALPDFDNFSAEPEKKKRKRSARFKQEAKEAKKIKLDNSEDSSECVWCHWRLGLTFGCLQMATCLP